MPTNLENSAVAAGLEKVSFHSNPKGRSWQRMFKLHTSYMPAIALIWHASKLMLKILQARLQQYMNFERWTVHEHKQYMNHELSDVQGGFRKGRGTRDQIANICWIIKKQERSRKTSASALLTMPKPLTVWVTINCGKFWKRWKYLPDSWETCMQVKKQQLELDMEQQTGYKHGKEYIKTVYCHPAYLTYMQSTSWKCWVEWSTS